MADEETLGQDRDFYQSLRERIRRWAGTREGKANRWTEYLLFAPDLFHLMCRLSLDPRVAVKQKAKLGGAIAYFIFPLDFVPEAITGPGGFVDDIALAAYVLKGIIDNAGTELVREHWAGNEDVLNLTERILGKADEMVGTGLWKKLKKLVKS